MSLSDKLRNPLTPLKPFSTRPELLRQRNVPKPLHQVAPRLVLGQEWWDKERRAAYRRSMYRCCACGVDARDAKERQALEAHEVYEVDYLAGRMVYVEAVALCHYCHGYIHCGRLEILARRGEITWEKYGAVMGHGRAVLASAGLVPQGPLYTKMARWEDWRMVVDGKEYPPVFKSYDEWLDHFGYNTENDDA